MAVVPTFCRGSWQGGKRQGGKREGGIEGGRFSSSQLFLGRGEVL